MPLIQCHIWETVKNETEMTPELLPSVMEISAADLARMGSIEPVSSRSPRSSHHSPTSPLQMSFPSWLGTPDALHVWTASILEPPKNSALAQLSP